MRQRNNVTTQQERENFYYYLVQHWEQMGPKRIALEWGMSLMQVQSTAAMLRRKGVPLSVKRIAPKQSVLSTDLIKDLKRAYAR